MMQLATACLCYSFVSPSGRSAVPLPALVRQIRAPHSAVEGTWGAALTRHAVSRTPCLEPVAEPVGESVRRWLDDLSRDDWVPLQTEPSFANPCFATSFLMGLSVQHAARHGLFLTFGLAPALVLVSSVLYWWNPQRSTWRRVVDLAVVRVSMAAHVSLAFRFCRIQGACLLLIGLTACGFCYATGRILTVRGRRWSGAWAHTGVHLFANLGNLMLLPYAI